MVTPGGGGSAGMTLKHDEDAPVPHAATAGGHP